jgi:methylmalonyl-CoA/ethylmalonyl-CoA epimerase
MILRLDHVAVAVSDLPAAISRLQEDLGVPLSGTEDVPTEKTSTAFFPLAGTRIELVHPMNGEGPIAGFLQKRGPGLHHLCFATDDLDGAIEKLRAKGYVFLSEAPKPGAHGTRVIFLHPKSFDGVLVELAEHPHESVRAAHEGSHP